jgi:hypothetical protein
MAPASNVLQGKSGRVRGGNPGLVGSRVEVCALSALCAIRVGFGGIGAGFPVLYFDSEGCGPSWPGGGSPVDKAEAQELFESEVDSLFADVAMKEAPDLDPA